MMSRNTQKDATRRLMSFINENSHLFKVRECRLYCQYSESENRLWDKEREHSIDNDADKDPQDRDCVCGRKKSKHVDERRVVEPEFGHGRRLWTIYRNTEFAPSFTFGEVIFHDKVYPRVEGSRANFLRLKGFHSPGTDKAYMEAVRKVMLDKDYWAMPEPRLIIEVTGTAKDGDIEKLVDYSVAKTLKEGLVKAVRDASAWIVTGGSNSGVMRLIGDEVAKYQRLDQVITCLGIATWGCLRNRADLVKDELIVDYNVEHTPSTEFSLNHGHNYYLLVDNAREKMYGEEIDFRHELINHIAETLAESTKVTVPVVMLALGGGMGTLQTLEDCFGVVRDISPSAAMSISRSSAVTPNDIVISRGMKSVVILYGFGGATDLLADVYKTFVVDNSQGSNEEDIKHFIKNRPSFARLCGDNNSDEDRKQKLADRVFRCYQVLKNKGDLLTVYYFSSDSGQSLSDTILLTALKNSQNTVLALQLARLWKATDAAREILKTRQSEIHLDAKGNEQIAELLQDAVASGQNDFLSLLFSCKLITKNYLSHSDVFAIYKKVLERKHSETGGNYVPFLKSIADSHRIFANAKKEIDGLRFVHLGACFSKLIGCFCLNLFLEEDFYQSQLRDCCLLDTQSDETDETIQFQKVIRVLQNQSGSTEERKKQLHFTTKYRDLFLLQLVLNQQNEADFLWKSGCDLIGTALVASIFLKNLAKLARRNDRYGLADVYTTQSEKWERRAEKVLDQSYEYRQPKVSWLLTRNLSNWQNRSVFEIAFYGRCMEFVKHEAVQIKLHHIWFGRISAFTRSIWIYLAALFPIPFLWVLKFIPYDASGKEKMDVVLKKSELIQKSTNNGNVHVNMDEKQEFCELLWYCFPPKKVSPTSYIIDQEPQHSFEEKSLCNKNIGFAEAFKSLWTASMVRFFWHVLFMFVFLLLFSSFVLTCTLSSTGVTVHEGFVLAWSACFLIDLVHETYADDIAVISRMKTSLKVKVNLFFRTVVWKRFNIFDWEEIDFYNAILPLSAGILLLISFVLRMVLDPVDYIYPRTTYSLTCLLFWLQAMRVFNVTRSVGIIVTILSELVSTLFAFLLVYTFLLLAFSIPTFALISPRYDRIEAYNFTSDDLSDELGVPVQQSAQRSIPQSMYNGANSFFTILVKVVYNRWWNLVQFDTDNSRNAVEGVCPSPDEGRSIASLPVTFHQDGSCDSEFNFVAVILYIVFIFITNIAWLNVLIATLSEQVGEIRKNAEKLSKFKYLVAVRTLYYRCYTPPPISIIEICVRILLFYYRPDYDKENIDFLDDRFGRDVHIKLDELERRCANIVLKAENEIGTKS